MIVFNDNCNIYNIPTDFKFKLFDLKKINTLARNHPFQHLVFILYKYCGDFLTNEEYDNDYILDEFYFILLDRYYRYGITFEDDNVYDKNKLYVYEDFEENQLFNYIIRNHYNFKQRVFNDVKLINLDDLDKGKIIISEIEKWKRKVIKNQKDRRTKLNLLDPNIYNSLITFVAFSNFKGRSHKKVENYFTYEGIDKIHRYNNIRNKYKNMKIYKDKIYNKIKNFLK